MRLPSLRLGHPLQFSTLAYVAQYLDPITTIKVDRVRAAQVEIHLGQYHLASVSTDRKCIIIMWSELRQNAKA
ncbi:hypothetical protein KFU94_01630 [Chloroflexi bacterium TSY]|nr:hypothetical protein [Chloroflexi bacterium TSY]